MGSGGSKGLTDEEMEQIKENTRFDSSEIKQWHDKFHEDFPEGCIGEEQFIEMYAQMCPKGYSRDFARNVFKAYDADGNGSIDFQEFMVTLSVSSRGTPEEKLQWAFKMYDTNNDGMVSLQEVTEMLTSIYRMRGERTSKSMDEIANVIFQHLDKNKDGEISLDEFVNGALKSPSIMKAIQGK